MCDEVGSGDLGSIYQTSAVVKYFISFFHCLNEILTIISFHCFAKNGDYQVSAAIILGSARLMDPSLKLQLIRSMWSMVALKIDTFTDLFLMVSIEPGL